MVRLVSVCKCLSKKKLDKSSLPGLEPLEFQKIKGTVIPFKLTTGKIK